MKLFLPIDVQCFQCFHRCLQQSKFQFIFTAILFYLLFFHTKVTAENCTAAKGFTFCRDTFIIFGTFLYWLEYFKDTVLCIQSYNLSKSRSLLSFDPVNMVIEDTNTKTKTYLIPDQHIRIYIYSIIKWTCFSLKVI